MFCVSDVLPLCGIGYAMIESHIVRCFCWALNAAGDNSVVVARAVFQSFRFHWFPGLAMSEVCFACLWQFHVQVAMG